MRNLAAQKPWHCAVAVSAANWDAHRAVGSVATSAAEVVDARTAGLRANRDTEFQYANAQSAQSAHTNVWRRFMRRCARRALCARSVVQAAQTEGSGWSVLAGAGVNTTLEHAGLVLEQPHSSTTPT